MHTHTHTHTHTHALMHTHTHTQTVEQDAYDFFTGAIEDLALPEATPKPGEEGANEEVDGEEEREEMDTSALIEQVCKDADITIFSDDVTMTSFSQQ